MTRILVAILMLAFAPLALAVETGRAAPDFTVTDGGGKAIRLSEYRGKQAIYVDFWASWCIPCRNSFPWMNELQSRFPNIKILAINLDERREDADRFLAAVPARFPIAFDPKGAVARSYDVKVMPSSMLIDADGVVRLEHRGFRAGDAAALEKQLATLLKAER
jgi:cytochrome c biogenesis protein CcmG/thiol:disulfide interchange protein DsbE